MSDDKRNNNNFIGNKLLLPLSKGFRCLKNEGIAVCFYKVKKKIDRRTEYDRWIRIHEKDIFEVKDLKWNPLFSIVVPVYNVERQMLTECIESVIAQTYKNWELILVDDASTMSDVRQTLSAYENRNGIKVIYRQENGHISRATNTGIECAKGEFVGLLDCDDLLAPNALYEMAKAWNRDKTLDYIYSDEDKITADGRKRRYPFFKPDWSPDTIMSLMYTCHFSVFRKSLLDELGGLRVGLEGSQDYDLVLRLMERTNRIGHIPKILYHWRERKESTASDAGAKPYILEATKKAKEEAISRRGWKAHLEYLDFCTQYRVVYEVVDNPKVSIIIPSKDNFTIFKQCLDSLCEHTTYDNYEIIVVDNGSLEDNRKQYEELCEKHGAAYYYKPMEFNFSHMCNLGAGYATGDYYLFLNDDIKIIQTGWLSRLLGHAQLSHVGAVGCKLLYPDSTLIQHSGVMNLANGPGHAFAQMDDTERHSWDRNKIEYNFSAVTGACLLLSKEKFDEVGGFEEELRVGYNDVDLCIKLLEAGYYNVLRNDVTLIHYESISRGDDKLDSKKAARLKREQEILFSRHPWYRHHDPCYNVNLVKDKGDYSLDTTDYSQRKKAEQYVMLKTDKRDICWLLEDVMDEEYTWVTGYAFYKDTMKSAPISLILKDETGQTYIVKAKNRYRQDILRIYDTKDIAFCGFGFSFDKETLPKGQYDMGLLVGKTYKELDATITV